MNARRDIIGRVLRASTSGFDCGIHSNKIDERHSFGAFVKVIVARGGAQAIGLIHAIKIVDDPLVRELVMSANIDNSTLMDQRDNRMVPVETCVINVGYMLADGTMIHSLPPRPPLSLTEVELCTVEEICQFTARYDFFRLVLNASEVSPDDLLATSLAYAADCHYALSSHREGEQMAMQRRYDFMVGAGRELARLLANDVRRLSHILELIRPI